MDQKFKCPSKKTYIIHEKKKYDYTYIFKEVINKIIFQTCQHYLHSNPLAMTRNFFARFIAIQECVRIKSSEYHMTYLQCMFFSIYL